MQDKPPLIHILTEDVFIFFSQGLYTGCRIPWDIEGRKLRPGLVVTHDLSVVTCEKCIKKANKILKQMKQDEEDLSDPWESKLTRARKARK